MKVSISFEKLLDQEGEVDIRRDGRTKPAHGKT